MRPLLVAVAFVLLQAASPEESVKNNLTAGVNDEAVPPQPTESQDAIRTDAKESVEADERPKESKVPAEEPTKAGTNRGHRAVHDEVPEQMDGEQEAKKPARILFLYAHAAISHIGSMTPYMKSLRDAGHEIVVLQTGPEDKPRSYGANTSVVLFKVPQDDGLLEMIPQIVWKQTSHATEPPIIMSLGDVALGQFVDQYSDKISDLLNQHWDLVVIDALFCPHGFAFATFLNRYRDVPFVIYSTSWVIPSSAASMSLGRNWPSSLSMFMPIQQDTRDIYKPKLFSNRLVTTLENGIDLIAHHVLAPRYLLTNLPRVGVDRFTMNELHRRSSFFLSDGFHGFEMPQAEAFNVRFAGAYCSKPKPLTDELKAFVEDPTSKGTIYIAFGSFTTWEHAPKHVYDAILEAIDELAEYRIIFSAKGATARVGKHVRMLSWAPQMDILAHPKTKVFFTHGGLKSLKEAICANTPVSFMPLFAEQARNAKLAAADGLGTVLNKYVVTKRQVMDALLEVLENPSYADRMDRLHSQFLDRPMAHLDEATFLTNRVLRKNGKDVYFRIKGQDLAWSSYLYLDWFAVVALLVYAGK